jgi:hypothetical protein
VPTFRLETHDGQHDTIEANRLDITDDQIVFIQRRQAGWRAVATAELAEVRSVERRFTEVDGRRRYVSDKDVAAAVHTVGSRQ